MFKKLFGRNISVNCEYCANLKKNEEDMLFCSVNKEIVDENCSGFKYDPLMRKPKTILNLKTYNPEEFKI